MENRNGGGQDARATVEPAKQGGYESLGAAMAAARHAVERIDPVGANSRGAGYFAANPGQQMRAWFSDDGVELASGIATPEGEEPWSVKLRLQEVGREGAMSRILPGSMAGEGSRVETRHPDAAVTQWFENRREGLEQGFTLNQAPAGDADEVKIVLEIEGTLQAVAMAGGDGVRFVDAAGAEVLHYRGLKAWDADGRVLEASLETRGPGGLALIVADAGARYPVTVDPLFANVEARLVERSVAQDFFGSSVALAGDTAVIGAPFEDTLGLSDAGCAYVFVRAANHWRLQAKLTADDLAAGDFFGTAVAISGDTIVGGADWADAAANVDAGKAYVFVRSGSVWQQQAKIMAGDAAADDHFGSAVAVSGDTVVVGAAADDTQGGMDAGSAYVFARSGTMWTQQSQLKAYDAAEGDAFGSSVSIAGGTAVIGAPFDDTAAGVDAGSAYVFVRSGTAWNHEGHLVAPDAAADDGFGCAVAVSADTALVGSKGDDTAAGADAGSTHVFVRSGVVWSPQSTLVAGSVAAGDAFGSVVSLDGDTAVVGAPEHASQGKAGSGCAVVFSRSGVVWIEQAELTASDPDVGDSFGAAVAVSGSSALIGALGDDTEAGMDAGSAAVFVNAGTGWDRQAGLVEENSRVEDFFGVSVAISGDTALVGAFADDTPAGADAGSAYVFVRREMQWAQEAKLSAGEGAAGDAFGASVSLSGDTAFIGASGNDTPGGVNAGSVSVFARHGTGWVEEQMLAAGDGAAGDRFGCSLALNDDTALVGAVGDDTSAGANAGSVYVFRYSVGAWTQEYQLHADNAAAEDGFGGAVALDGETALVGASGANTPAGLDAGQAYVFTRSGLAWSQQARLAAPDAAADDRFGAAVAISGDTSLVGAPDDFGPSGPKSGSAHVFHRVGTMWNSQAKLTSSDAIMDERFGSSVAVDGDVALIGSPLDDLPVGSSAGSASLFRRNGVIWTEQLKLTAGVDASASDEYGTSVALSGDIAIVGAYADTTLGPGAGSAYVYSLGQLPEILQQPSSRTVLPGQVVTFSITAVGSQPMRYQWRRNGFPVDGATSSSLTFDSVAVGDQGGYDCVVSNIGGVVTSAVANLAVNVLSALSQNQPSVLPDAQGFVFVLLLPSGIGSGWRFVGEQQWRIPGIPVGGLATGDYDIEFKPLVGQIQPPRETISVFSGQAATLVERTYYVSVDVGSSGLTVILKPDDLADPGVPEAQRAQWRLLGEDDTQWRNSGDTIGSLLPGNYLVECKPVVGRTTPSSASIGVSSEQNALLTVTYRLTDPPLGVFPSLVPFETVSMDSTRPYGFVGQIRSDVGSGSGFLIKPRVVATAGHVVFDDGTLSAVTGLQWLHQRHRGTYEPAPKSPRGYYIFDGYAAQRTAENTPGSSSPQSQHLDAAAIYFLEDVGRGGASGYLASDLDDNEFIMSSADKLLAGYPVDGISSSNQGRMHATAPMNAVFARGYGRTFTSSDIRGNGGMSGGPLCVLHDNGNYYPAAIYLGGSGQTVVRSIDSAVIDLFSRAEISGNGGTNQTGGGITHTSVSSIGTTSSPGVLKVTIQPAAARDAGAGWKLNPESYYRLSGAQKSGLSAGTYTLQLRSVDGFETPVSQTVSIKGGQLKEVTFTYADQNDPPSISAIANRTINEDGSTGIIGFMIADPDDSLASLVLDGTSSTPLLVPESNIVLGGTAANRTVIVTPVANQSGTATITISVSDGSLSVTESFTLTVNAVNDAPTITGIADQSIAVYGATNPLVFTIGDVETSAAALTLGKTSSYTTLVPLDNVVFGGSGSNRTVIVTPAPGQLGSATITVTVGDGTATMSESFLVTVTGTALETWRFSKFGTTNNTDTSSDNADPDGDGQTNLEEYAAGTDPNDASDVIKIVTATKTGGVFTVTTFGRAGRTYILQRSLDLTTGIWSRVATLGPVDSDGSFSLADQSAPSDNCFYRIQVSVQ